MTICQTTKSLFVSLYFTCLCTLSPRIVGIRIKTTSADNKALVLFAKIDFRKNNKTKNKAKDSATIQSNAPIRKKRPFHRDFTKIQKVHNMADSTL